MHYLPLLFLKIFALIKITECNCNALALLFSNVVDLKDKTHSNRYFMLYLLEEAYPVAISYHYLFASVINTRTLFSANNNVEESLL